MTDMDGRPGRTVRVGRAVLRAAGSALILLAILAGVIGTAWWPAYLVALALAVTGGVITSRPD